MFKKISSIPSKEYNDVTIKFIKEFTDSALFRVWSLKDKESSEPWFSLENELEETQEKLNLAWIENIEEEIKTDYSTIETKN